jgi:hypothetical protein
MTGCMCSQSCLLKTVNNLRVLWDVRFFLCILRIIGISRITLICLDINLGPFAVTLCSYMLQDIYKKKQNSFYSVNKTFCLVNLSLDESCGSMKS